MTDRLVIELDPGGAVMRSLGDAIRGLQRPRELMDAIGAKLESNINQRFDTKTAPDGTPWLQLAPGTREHYERKYKGKVPGSLLERSRRMRDSLSHAPGDASVEVGFSVPYAIHHEFGTRRGLPRRQLLTDDPVAGTLAAGDEQDVLDEIEGYLRGIIGGA